MKAIISLPLLILMLITLGCEGPQGDAGAPGEVGPIGEIGAVGTDGPSGSMGSQGETGTDGEAGPSGSHGESCSATDQGDGTYVVTCPGADPITLNEDEPIRYIEGVYQSEGEPMINSVLILKAFVPEVDVVAFETVITDSQGRFTFETPSTILLDSGRLYLTTSDGHSALIHTRSIVVDEISTTMFDMLSPFYQNAYVESEMFTAETLALMDSTVRDLTANAMDMDTAVRAALQDFIRNILQGEITGKFVSGNPLTSSYTETLITTDILDEFDIDYISDENSNIDVITDDGGLWDIYGNGVIDDGGDDAYDGVMYLKVSLPESNTQVFDANLLDGMIRGPNHITFSGQMVFTSGVNNEISKTIDVTRQLLVNRDDTEGGHWLRYTDTLSNPNSEMVTLTVTYESDLGSDGDEEYGPSGDDWHTSVEIGYGDNTLGFYYPDIDQISIDGEEITMSAQVVIEPNSSISLNTWLFKSVGSGSQNLAEITAEIEAVRGGGELEAVLAVSANTNIIGEIGSVGPGSVINIQMNDESVYVVGDQLGRFNGVLFTGAPEASLVVNGGEVELIAIPDEDECLVANGSCGETIYAECINQMYMQPICNDIETCGVDNGGCGDPSVVTCVEQDRVAPICEDIAECAIDNGGCENLFCIERFADANNGCSGLPYGIQRELPVADLTQLGFSICHQSNYNQSNIALSDVLMACAGDELIIACRPTGSDTFTLAAGGPRSEVLTDIGDGREASTESNGVAFYYDDNSSIGFAPVGATINRSLCDRSDRGPDDGEERLCWYTSNGNLDNGYRCGQNRTYSSSWERTIMVR